MDMRTPECKIHRVPLVCFCPACRGMVRSERKAKSSRENGKRGGRPKGSGRDNTASLRKEEPE